MKSEAYFKSCDNKTKIHNVIWSPDSDKYPKPIAVVQLAHGMREHIERFSGIAEYLTDRGIVVVGNDHLGHGQSVSSEENFCFFREYKPEDALVTDMHRLTVIMKKKYKGIPYFLAGHSMGSFMTRKYMSLYGDELDGAIILGTGNQPKPGVMAALAMVSIVGIFRGEHYRSKTIANFIFGHYNKRIKEKRTDYDWLSRDEAVVDAYIDDKLCSHLFTINGYKGLFRTILFVEDKKNISLIPEKLPVLLASGEEDPVGNYAKDVIQVYKIYHNQIDDIELQIYANCRHELCNELNKEKIYQDIYDWLMRHIKSKEQ